MSQPPHVSGMRLLHPGMHGRGTLTSTCPLAAQCREVALRQPRSPSQERAKEAKSEAKLKHKRGRGAVERVRGAPIEVLPSKSPGRSLAGWSGWGTACTISGTSSLHGGTKARIGLETGRPTLGRSCASCGRASGRASGRDERAGDERAGVVQAWPGERG